MTEAEESQVVTTWFGAFRVERGSVVAAHPFPRSPGALAERLARRRDGGILPEEEALVKEAAGRTLVSRDRRLTALGVTLRAVAEPELDPRAYGFDPAEERELLLTRADGDLQTEWDPSIHVQETVRALTSLDEVLNTLGERLASWAEQDRPAGGEEDEAHRRLARDLLEGAPGATYAVPSPDPALARARQQLAELYLAVERTQAGLERALAEAMPTRAPNMTALLGPELAARLISQAGSLRRLAQLPASTVQVLGAERAFFEHLRGHAPPPRHGLLFLHAKIHSAPRSQRGRLARALAGKTSIAARLDLAGRPLDPTLASQFEHRAEEVRAHPVLRGARPRPGRRRKVTPST
jgi:nucleolar protein 56